MKACRASWSLQNPYWTTNFLSLADLHDFVPNPDRIRALQARKIPPAAFSDVIRNELLAIKTFDAVGGKMEFQPDGTVVLPMQINELTKGGTKILQ